MCMYLNIKNNVNMIFINLVNYSLKLEIMFSSYIILRKIYRATYIFTK